MRKSMRQIREEEESRALEINAKAQDIVQEMMPDLIVKLTSALMASKAAASMNADGTAGPVMALSEGDNSLLRNLAQSIAMASDPTRARSVVPPEVARAREEAYKRMTALILKHHAEGTTPVYFVTSLCYLNDTLVYPEWRDPATKRFYQTRIKWKQVPNQAMKPENEAAKEIFAEFERWMGAVTVEGAPEAPWMNPNAPNWVRTKDGIVLGPSMAQLEEMNAPAAPNGAGFEDPRVMTGMGGVSSGAVPKTTHVLGTVAPPVIENAQGSM